MVKENQLPGTDYNYILGREFVIFSNGVTMSIEEFKTFHHKGILVKKIMSLARVPKRLSDYQIALETGVLTPVYMPVKTMQLNPEKPKVKKEKKSKEIIVPEANITVVEQPERPVKEQQKKSIIPANKSQVIFLTMLFIAAGSACMSIYHAAAILIYGGKPFLIAALTAVLIGLFASTGFTAARYFSEQKGFAKVFALPFVVITSVLICYIAFSTTSVSYEQFRDEEAAKVAGVQKEIGTLELHSEVQKSITETEKYLRKLEATNMEGKTKEAFARHQRMIMTEREKLQKLRDKSFTLKEKAGGGSIEDKKQSITSVYDFLMELFGINSRVLRFIIYVIPAVFYDIVAPFGFTVVFFLADNKQEELNEE
jgi:hypothetical protein